MLDSISLPCMVEINAASTDIGKEKATDGAYRASHRRY